MCRPALVGVIAIVTVISAPVAGQVWINGVAQNDRTTQERRSEPRSWTPPPRDNDCCCLGESDDALARTRKTRPVMLVKLPRTGSSWLATVINSAVSGGFEVERKRTPETYAAMLSSGLSLSMEPWMQPARCMDYAKVLDAANNAKPLLLFLYRCNDVKFALSNAFSFEFEARRRACPAPDAGPGCAENFPYGPAWPRRIDPAFLKNQIVCSRARTRYLHAVYDGVKKRARKRLRAVSYEALQSDETAVAAAIEAAVSCGGGPPSARPRRRRLLCGVGADGGVGGNATACEKHSPDDLRGFISNFDEIAAFLGDAAPCLRAMLEEPGTSCTECVDDYWPDAVCDEPTFKHVARFAVPEDDCAIRTTRMTERAWLCPECERKRRGGKLGGAASRRRDRPARRRRWSGPGG